MDLRRLLGFVVLLAVGCAAHEPNPVHDRIGVEFDGEAIAVLYLACPGEVIEEVSFWLLDDDNITRNDGDVMSWSADPLSLATFDGSAFAVGDEAGAIRLESGPRYLVNVETSTVAGDPGVIRMEDLEVGKVFASGRSTSHEDFSTAAAESCQ